MIDPRFQNLEAEEALLGILLTNNQTYNRVYSHIAPEDFSIAVHERIYSEIVKAINTGRVAEPVFLNKIFSEDRALEHVGGGSYLAHLAANKGPDVNATDYAREVARMAKIRRMHDLGQRIQRIAAGAVGVTDVDNVMDEITAEMFELGKKASEHSNMVTSAEVAEQSRKAVELIYKNGGRSDGLSTGFKGIDEKIGGLSPGRMVVVAGRPGMGKTAWAMNVVENIARNGRKVGVFTMEMAPIELQQRMEAAAIGMPSRKLTEEPLTKEGFKNFCQESEKLGEAPIIYFNAGTINIDTLCMNIRRYRQQFGIELAMIDYLQKIQPKNGNSRYEMVTEASSKISALAKDLDIPILLLSQLSRNVDMRDDKQPTMSDLRESGQIEQDAYQVIMLYRHYYYLQMQPKNKNQKGYDEWLALCEKHKSVAKAIIGKNRNGTTGDVVLGFNGALTKFYDRTQI